MIQIRPVSDLRNKFTEIESTVKGRFTSLFDKEWIWIDGSNEY